MKRIHLLDFENKVRLEGQQKHSANTSSSSDLHFRKSKGAACAYEEIKVKETVVKCKRPSSSYQLRKSNNLTSELEKNIEHGKIDSAGTDKFPQKAKDNISMDNLAVKLIAITQHPSDEYFVSTEIVDRDKNKSEAPLQFDNFRVIRTIAVQAQSFTEDCITTSLSKLMINSSIHRNPAIYSVPKDHIDLMLLKKEVHRFSRKMVLGYCREALSKVVSSVIMTQPEIYVNKSEKIVNDPVILWNKMLENMKNSAESIVYSDLLQIEQEARVSSWLTISLGYLCILKGYKSTNFESIQRHLFTEMRGLLSFLRKVSIILFSVCDLCSD